MAASCLMVYLVLFYHILLSGAIGFEKVVKKKHPEAFCSGMLMILK
jgi:hypothetical protein